MMLSFLAGRKAASLGREKCNLKQTAQLERLWTHHPAPPSMEAGARSRHRGTESQMQLAGGHHQKSLWVSQDPSRKHIAHSNQEDSRRV